MRVLICGGRDYARARHLRERLDALAAEHKFTLVVTGGATGADTLADRWAEARGIDRVICPANWVGRSKLAGPDRNGLMLRLVRPDLVVAFEGGAGTADLLRQARAAKVRVIQVPEEDEPPLEDNPLLFPDVVGETGADAPQGTEAPQGADPAPAAEGSARTSAPRPVPRSGRFGRGTR
ncbi:hypothetical protein M446_4151 [Methylobacterium sp. 4-46]|uniref:DUF2493 domain-containing protein n=1 Tax=unclassified Methylobacterium TaxID=2615210 RepID=UPI000165C91F|nr:MULTISPECIES: DUF2493 domain-containing protein [Methylobacterium]ACA18508.1 hypothetical protein M446_4151 [Methylobacterium sp. 4-46]WFT77795.1 DUF2493 domain-containing protein [Methylobacterium nodulans]